MKPFPEVIIDVFEPVKFYPPVSAFNLLLPPRTGWWRFRGGSLEVDTLATFPIQNKITLLIRLWCWPEIFRFRSGESLELL